MATGSVAWVDGDGPLATLRGDFSVARGCQSLIEVFPIVALSGAPRVNLFDVVPSFSKHKLFRRQRMTCAYCGQRFAERELQCEHIVPQAQGGGWSWKTSCSRGGTSVPTCRCGWLRACRKDHG